MPTVWSDWCHHVTSRSAWSWGSRHLLIMFGLYNYYIWLATGIFLSSLSQIVTDKAVENCHTHSQIAPFPSWLEVDENQLVSPTLTFLRGPPNSPQFLGIYSNFFSFIWQLCRCYLLGTTDLATFYFVFLFKRVLGTVMKINQKYAFLPSQGSPWDPHSPSRWYSCTSVTLVFSTCLVKHKPLKNSSAVGCYLPRRGFCRCNRGEEGRKQ